MLKNLHCIKFFTHVNYFFIVVLIFNNSGILRSLNTKEFYLSHYYAKQMFLTKLKDGPKSYRNVRDAIKWHYKEADVKKIRDELEAEEYIVLSHFETKHFGKQTREVPFYKLCEPKLTVHTNKVISGFDYSGPSTIFTKQEKANMMSTLKVLEIRANERLQKKVQINVYGKA